MRYSHFKQDAELGLAAVRIYDVARANANCWTSPRICRQFRPLVSHPACIIRRFDVFAAPYENLRAAACARKAQIASSYICWNASLPNVEAFPKKQMVKMVRYRASEYPGVQ